MTELKNFKQDVENCLSMGVISMDEAVFFNMLADKFSKRVISERSWERAREVYAKTVRSRLDVAEISELSSRSFIENLKMKLLLRSYERNEKYDFSRSVIKSAENGVIDYEVAVRLIKESSYYPTIDLYGGL